MELSLYLAQVLGVLYLVVALSLLFNKAFWMGLYKKWIKSDSVLFSFGVLRLVAGLLIVLKHNMWEPGFVGLITFLGWALVLKGAIGLLFPAFTKKTAKSITISKWYNFAILLLLVFGVYLTYMGFFV